MKAVRKRVGEDIFMYLVCDRCGIILAVVTGRDLNIYFPNKEEEPGLCQECAVAMAGDDMADDLETPF
jgi:hypothetical protein